MDKERPDEPHSTHKLPQYRLAILLTFSRPISGARPVTSPAVRDKGISGGRGPRVRLKRVECSSILSRPVGRVEHVAQLVEQRTFKAFESLHRKSLTRDKSRRKPGFFHFLKPRGPPDGERVPRVCAQGAACARVFVCPVCPTPRRPG